MKNTEEKFLEETLKYLVKYPESIEVKKITDGMGTLYTVKVHEEDTFKVIGKKGQTVNALRILLRTVGYLNRVRASLKIDVDKTKQ